MLTENLLAGLLATFTFEGIAFIAMGTIWGIISGALPGINASMGMALILPFAIGIEPVNAFSMLAAVYVGAEYGGSIPSILIATPGTSAAACTVLDGNMMHKNGFSGKALSYSLCAGAFGSFVGGIVSITMMVSLAKVALMFGPADFFALSIFGLSAVISMSSGSFIKGFISLFVGLLFGAVGSDLGTGTSRFVFGMSDLMGGLHQVPVVIGLVAGGEIVSQILAQIQSKKIATPNVTSSNLSFVTFKEMLATWRVAIFGTITGIIVGVMPGAGATIAAFVSYNESRRVSKDGHRYGQGVPDGIVAPESANNACVPSSFVPLLLFGIPGSSSAAIMLGAMIMHGMRPGPMFMTTDPDILYSFFLAVLLSSVALLVIGRLLLKVFLYVTYVRAPHLYTCVFALLITGMLSLNEGMFPVYLLLIFSVIGYLAKVAGYNAVCMVLGFVLSSMIENNFRRALMLTRGDFTVFLKSPISLVLLILTGLAVFYGLRRQKKQAEA